MWEPVSVEPLPVSNSDSARLCAGLTRLTEAIPTPPSDWADGLKQARPELSAGTPMWAWQRAVLALVVVISATALLFDTGVTFLSLMALTIPAFLSVVVVRVASLILALRASAPATSSWPSAVDVASGQSLSLSGNLDFEASVPFYTVLVPLYDETAAIDSLVPHLRALDWPSDRLEILFLIEAEDHATGAALARADLAPTMRVLMVPDGLPRTKPRALTYGLLAARGDLVGVYDAEDMPPPEQLRQAAAMLLSDDRIGCVQARLNIYNPTESWFTRQFTIEYSALFDAILPALERMRLPIPLGGTSNHFRRAALDGVGGWDPYNVTEDADLGIRLARSGWMVRVLASTTWEEAPATFRVWLGQRVRWLKGWTQTYLVHMREPMRLGRQLGVRGWLGFQILLGGLVLSALLHPLAYAAVAWAIWHGGMPSDLSGIAGLIAWIGLNSLLIAYGTGIALGWVTIRQRGHAIDVRHFAGLPLYWLLISYAAYRAIWQFVMAPYCWNKTPHRGASSLEGMAFQAPMTRATPRWPTAEG